MQRHVTTILRRSCARSSHRPPPSRLFNSARTYSDESTDSTADPWAISDDTSTSTPPFISDDDTHVLLRRADQEALADSKRQLIRWKASFDKAVAVGRAIPDEIYSSGIDGHYQLGYLREYAHTSPTKQAAGFDEALEKLLLNLTDLQSESYRDPQAPDARMEAFKDELEGMSQEEREARYEHLKNEELAMRARLMREGEELNALVTELGEFDPSRRFARTMEEENAKSGEDREAEGETEGKASPPPKEEDRSLEDTMAQMEADLANG